MLPAEPDRGHSHLVLRERPGFIRAYDACRPQCFDGWEALDDRMLLRQAFARGGQCDRNLRG